MMNAVICAGGIPTWSMASMLIVNIILHPVFILGFHWGMKVAALIWSLFCYMVKWL